MKKLNKLLISLFLILVISLFCPYSCIAKNNAFLLFNLQPINRDNLKYSSKRFPKGQRIYYLFASENKIESEYIRVQIFKISDNGPIGGYELINVNDYRLSKDEIHYYTDYVVINQSGHYVMQVFVRNKYNVLRASKPIVFNDFYVY